MKSINEKIGELRKAAGLTQEALGAKLGVSGQAVSKWEKGESLPDILLIPELCKLLGTSADELLEVQFPKTKRNGYIHVEVNDDETKHKMLFELNGFDYVKQCMSLEYSDIAWYLSVLTNEYTFRVLCAVPFEETGVNPISSGEICSATGLVDSDVSQALRILLKRNVIREVDHAERSATSDYIEPRYFQSDEVGIYMVLSGCCMGGCEPKGKTTKIITTTETHS